MERLTQTVARTTVRGMLYSVAVAVGMLCLPRPSHALINPRYTVADLARDSGTVLVLQVTAPQDGQVQGEVVEVLTGEAPPETALTFDVNEAEELTEDEVADAFGANQSTVAVMCVRKRARRGEPAGAIEIGTTWMGIARSDEDGLWKLDRDQTDLETVWAGSARTLVPAMRYAINDAAATFPVASALSWDHDQQLGTLAGPAHGCLSVDLGDGAPCVVLLSDGGDRAYQAAGKGMSPADVTAKLGLATASRLMVAGDVNGDGKLDLASWDGTRVRLQLRGADGRFAAPSAEQPLPDCRSLSATGTGGHGCALVAGQADGVAVLTLTDAGTFTVRQLAMPADRAALGMGGVCTVVDLNDDGTPDIVQAFSHGFVLYPGSRTAGTFDTPTVISVEAVKNPTAIICGDYDTDGLIDLLVGGTGGLTLLSRDADGRWSGHIHETGELGAGAGTGGDDAAVVAVCPADVNGDARQGVALFYPKASPSVFFNRGFACFGLARNLVFSELALPGAVALGSGQTAGILADLDGDRAPDLLGVDLQGGVWALLGKVENDRRFLVTARLANPALGPLTVTASLGQQRLGVWVVRPGDPATISLPRAGKVTLQWKTLDGTAAARDLVVTAPVTAEL